MQASSNCDKQRCSPMFKRFAAFARSTSSQSIEAQVLDREVRLCSYLKRLAESHDGAFRCPGGGARAAG